MDGMYDVQPIWLSHFLGNGHFRTRNKLSGMIIYDQCNNPHRKFLGHVLNTSMTK